MNQEIQEKIKQIFSKKQPKLIAKESDQKVKKKFYHSPDKLFCHHRFTHEQPCKKSNCPFRHEFYPNKIMPKRPENICPNGIKCPINHKKIECPIEKRDGVCLRKTVFGPKQIVKCEYKHKQTSQYRNEQEFILNQQKQAKKSQKIPQIQQQKMTQKEENLLNTQFQIYKIPKISKSPLKTSVIGIIDCSWSMEECFPLLIQTWQKYITNPPSHTQTNINNNNDDNNNHTITFQTIAKELRQFPSSYYEKYTDFGGTNIEAGFQQLNKLLQHKHSEFDEKQKVLEHCTLIFISDGEDDKPKTVKKRLEKLRSQVLKIQNTKKLSFMCVGVGNKFPTELAMQLRELYHNNDPSVPPLFLIEDPMNIKEWDSSFGKMSFYFQHKEQLTLDQQIHKYPWTLPKELSQIVYEDQYIFLPTQQQQNMVLIGKSHLNNEDIYINEYENKFNLKEIGDLAFQFMVDIQLRSLKKGQVRNEITSQAQKAIQIIEKLMQVFKTEDNKFKLKNDTHFRILNLQGIQLIKKSLISLKNLAEKNILEKLSQFQIAQRLAIGTQEGKYHEKALRYAGLTVEQFQEQKNEFIQNFNFYNNKHFNSKNEQDYKNEIENDKFILKLLKYQADQHITEQMEKHKDEIVNKRKFKILFNLYIHYYLKIYGKNYKFCHTIPFGMWETQIRSISQEELIKKLINNVNPQKIKYKDIEKLSPDIMIKILIWKINSLFSQIDNENDNDSIPDFTPYFIFLKKLRIKDLQLVQDMILPNQQQNNNNDNNNKKGKKSKFIQSLINQIENEQEYAMVIDEKSGEQTKKKIDFLKNTTLSQILEENSFLQGLHLIQNQYEFVETFPLIGMPVYIRRTEGSRINPFLISVEQIYEYPHQIDSLSLQDPENTIQNNEIHLLNKDNQTIKINAILPLFSKDSTNELETNFIKSPLFSILMTHNICQNCDTSLNNAYLALLSSALINLLNQKSSLFKTSTIEKILDSVHIAYGKNKSFQNQLKLLIESPFLAQVTEINEELAFQIDKLQYLNMKCEDPSKNILLLLYLKKFYPQKLGQKSNKTEQIFTAILQECMGRFIERGKHLVNQLEFEIKEEYKNPSSEIHTHFYYQAICDKVYNNSPQILIKKYYSHYRLRQEIRKVVNNLQIQLPEVRVHIPQTFMRQGKLNLKSLKNIFYYLFGETHSISWKLILKFAFFAYYFQDSSLRFVNMNQHLTFEQVEMVLKQGKLKQILMKKREDIFLYAEKQIVQLYFQEMEKTHSFSSPEKSILLQQSSSNKNNKGLSSNCCLYEQCPFFKLQSKHLAQHLEAALVIKGMHKIVSDTVLKGNLMDENIIYGLILQNLQKFDKNQKKPFYYALKTDPIQEFTNKKEKYIQQISILVAFYKQNKTH